MSNSVEQQFSELNLSQEDHDQYEQEDHPDPRLVPYIDLLTLIDAFMVYNARKVE